MGHRMRSKSAIIIFSIIAVLAFNSCGIKGPPKAPLRVVIPPVNDLQAVLTGSTVRLSWTPSLQYSDGDDLEIRSISVYRLDENLSERLAAQAEEEERRRAEGALLERGIPPVGPLNLYARRIVSLPVTDFDRKAVLVERLRIEQLIDRAAGGKIHWEEPLPHNIEERPSFRSVYAVVIEDARGRESNPSNFVQVIPLAAMPGPEAINYALISSSLSINWSPPARDEKALQQLSLLGYNVYKSAPDAPAPRVPANTTLIPTNYPMDWIRTELLSLQQVSGSTSRFACLLVTSANAKPAGLSQVLVPAEEITRHRGSTVQAEVIIYSPGGTGGGRLVLDASRDPAKPSEPAAGEGIFTERDNPLISIQDISIGEEPRSARISIRLPSDSRALVLRIEPRGEEAVSAPYIIESVSARSDASGEELVRNGDFSGFTPLRYIETVESYGEAFDYRVSAIYDISGFKLESPLSEPLRVELRDTTPPIAPASTKALSTGEEITISWNASSSTDTAGYVVFRREGSDGSWQRLNREPIVGTIYRDTEAKPGVVYFYKVEAIDKSGNLSSTTTIVTATRGTE